MSLPSLVQVSGHKAQGSDLPAVSWLLCTHVANAQLRQAVQTCLDQSFTDFELLLIINGSMATELATVVQAWFGADQRVRIYTTEVRHLIFSLSLGLHHARADLVARMDSDDLSTPDRLARQVAFMREHPEVAVLGSAYQIIDANESPQKTIKLPMTDTAVRRALLWGNPLCHPSVMFRRQVVLNVGGYLGGLHAEDYDLWLRLAADPTIKFANLDAVCLGYRSVGVGMARRARSGYASMASAQYRHFVNGFGIRWMLAALVSTLKAFVRSNRASQSRAA
jgi:cellulose synthase/poly-beta-1,6-N-acetylglucosamine synthase-like glycosyltransferase